MKWSEIMPASLQSLSSLDFSYSPATKSTSIKIVVFCSGLVIEALMATAFPKDQKVTENVQDVKYYLGSD